MLLLAITSPYSQSAGGQCLLARVSCYRITENSPVISKPISLHFFINHSLPTYRIHTSPQWFYLRKQYPYKLQQQALYFRESQLSPRVTLFSKKGMEWGRIVLILGNDIMDFRKEVRPVKIVANSMKIDQLPLFLRRTFQTKASTQVVKPVTPTGDSSVMQTLVAFQAYAAEKYAAKTAKMYWGDVRELSIYLRNKQLKDISTHDLQVMSCDDPYPPRTGLRSHSRVDQMRSVNPEAIAGVRW